MKKVIANCLLCEKEALISANYKNRYVCDDCKEKIEYKNLRQKKVICVFCKKEEFTVSVLSEFVCEDCKQTEQYKEKFFTKQLNCEDCGKTIKLSIYSNKKTIVCEECNEKRKIKNNEKRNELLVLVL